MENVEIILGTYENLLIGYKLEPSLTKGLVLESSFTEDSHRGALRCVSVSKTGVLASSSTDDSIRLHSLRKRKEIGGLFEHSGTVNSMVFHGKNHMFSASEDGTICLWQSKNWELMRTLKGHKAHVMAVAVHPSGKLGLSVGSDRSFLTWDLLTGKLAFQRKLLDVAQNIFFTPDGDFYVLVFNKKIEVCSLADTKTVKEVPFDWRINAVCHVEDNVFAVGGDDRRIILIDVLEGTRLLSLDAAKSETDDFKSRVRSISVVQCEGNTCLFMSTATGDIKAFKLNLPKKTSEEVFFGEAKVRVTTMAVYNKEACDTDFPTAKVSVTTKKKIAEDEIEEENDDIENSEDDSDEPSEEASNSIPKKPQKRKADKALAPKANKKKKSGTTLDGYEQSHIKSKKGKGKTGHPKKKASLKKKVKNKLK